MSPNRSLRQTAALLLLGVTAFQPVHLHARDDYEVYVAPGITFMRSDDARASEEGYGLSLGLGIAGASNLGYEASLVLNEFEESSRNTPGWRELGVRGGVQYTFHRDAVANRFLDAGLSAIRTERTDINDPTTSAALDVGIGLEHDMLGSGNRLRGGLRYRILLHDAESGFPGRNASTFGELAVHFGLLFGRSSSESGHARNSAVQPTQVFVYTSPETVKAAAAVGMPYPGIDGKNVSIYAVAPENATEEGDIVAPSIEASSTPAAKAAVLAESAPGASETTATDSVAAGALEGDEVVEGVSQVQGDAVSLGVADESRVADESPVSREEGPVEEEIPVLVTPDYPYSCVDSAVGACELPDEIRISRSFASGSFALSRAAAERLEIIAPHLSAALGARPGGRVVVEGHTDATGSQGYNQWLSKRRAQAVRAALASHGIAMSDIVAMGLGSEFPLSSNGTLEGQRDNRRVEISVYWAEARDQEE